VTTVYTTAHTLLPEYGTVEELQAEADRFEAATGFCFLSLVFGGSEAEARATHPAWVVDWAAHLNCWDCWLFLPEEDLTTPLELLEADLDTPVAPRTHGRARPQALRSARARRSTFLGRVTRR